MSKSTIRNTDWAKYLIENFLPVNQIDIMKDKFGIELELEFTGEWMDIDRWCDGRGLTSPCYADGNNSWYNGKPLTFGSMCGWDVTEDGKFALCRIAYEDYRLFKVVERPILVEPTNIKNEIPKSDKIEQLRKEIQEIKKTQEEILNLLRNK